MENYTPELELRIAHWAKEREKASRFAHTERVVETVTRLAEQWSPDDIAMLRLAAWIHDAAKHYSDDELLYYAESHQLAISEGERVVPMLLHGAVAYAEANKLFNLNDERIRTACAYHTTGDPTMSFTDKLLFLADLIEPDRDFPSAPALREMAVIDIDKTMLMSVDRITRYLLNEQRFIDPRVIALYNVLIRV